MCLIAELMADGIVTKNPIYDLTGKLSFTIMGERKVTCHLMEIIITKDMKEKVLSTAPEIFSQKGNEGTNIRDLSASCGLVKSGEYLSSRLPDARLPE